MRKLRLLVLLGLALMLVMVACNNEAEESYQVSETELSEDLSVEESSVVEESEETEESEVVESSETEEEESSEEAEVTTYENTETQVLVIGGGGAGLTAAASAHENGAVVILVERQANTGGSTSYSGGGIAATDTRFQQEQGIEDSKESWMELWEERQSTGTPSEKYPDYEFVDYFMDEAVVTTEWLVDYAGHEYGSIEGFGVDPVERLHFPVVGEGQSGGMVLATNIADFLKEEGIEIRVKNKAVALLTDDNGAVIGATIEAEDENGETVTYDITADKVILAAGGFAKNEELLERFVPEMTGTADYSAAAPGSMGEGIMMAEEVGAALYDENWVIGLGITSHYPKENSLMMDWTKIYVDGNGERFTNEAIHYAMATNAVAMAEEPWAVFDSAEANADLITILEEGELEGEYVTADNIEALAAEMGADEATLVSTIETYNAGANGGEDEFGKPADFIVPVETGPFYAVKIYPKTMGTFGGVQTNENFEVLDENGEVIPNLYATGENANKRIYNQVYMSGSAVQWALTSGRIAGAHAANSLGE